MQPFSMSLRSDASSMPYVATNLIIPKPVLQDCGKLKNRIVEDIVDHCFRGGYGTKFYRRSEIGGPVLFQSH